MIDYIEPTNENKFVYSHRIYELLLRTATEFEAGDVIGVYVSQYEDNKPTPLQVSGNYASNIRIKSINILGKRRHEK